MIIQHKDSEITPDVTHHDVYTTPIKDGAFLFHKSFYLTYLHLLEDDPSLAKDYLDAILAYGFNQQSPDEYSDVWICGFNTIQFQIDIDAGRANL